MRICTHIQESTMARGWWSRWYQGLGFTLKGNLCGHVVCLPPCWLPTKACGMPLARSCVETLLHTASQAWHLHGGGFTPSCGLVVLPLKGPCKSELPKSNSLGIVVGASQGHGCACYPMPSASKQVQATKHAWLVCEHLGRLGPNPLVSLRGQSLVTASWDAASPCRK